MEAGMVGVVGTGGAIPPKSKSILGTGSTTGSSLNITSPMSEVAQISDASVDVPQTMLSPPAVPHMMLSPAAVPHTTLSQFAVPHAVPQTMLSPAAPRDFAAPQTTEVAQALA